MAGVDSGRRHVGGWVDELDRLTEDLRRATDAKVHAAAEETRQMNRFAQIKDDLDETEDAWHAAEREREEADNEVTAIVNTMQRVYAEATAAMCLQRPQVGGVRPEGADEEEEEVRAEAERLAGEARLALSPVELAERMREAIERATQGRAA